MEEQAVSLMLLADFVLRGGAGRHFTADGRPAAVDPADSARRQSSVRCFALGAGVYAVASASPVYAALGPAAIGR
jgi:hypothetical protein